MEPSLVALPLIVSLFLGFAHTTQAYDTVDYCTDPCPLFTRKYEDEKYEIRDYEPCTWMCTVVEEPTTSALIKAGRRLTDFQNQHGIAGKLPSLISEKDLGEDKVEYKHCWFIPPENSSITSTEGDVTVETFPRVSMFVRSSGGFPSLTLAEDSAAALKKDLGDIPYIKDMYYAVTYDSIWSFYHHNELWIAEDQT